MDIWWVFNLPDGGQVKQKEFHLILSKWRYYLFYFLKHFYNSLLESKNAFKIKVLIVVEEQERSLSGGHHFQDSLFVFLLQIKLLVTGWTNVWGRRPAAEKIWKQSDGSQFKKHSHVTAFLHTSLNPLHRGAVFPHTNQ